MHKNFYRKWPDDYAAKSSIIPSNVYVELDERVDELIEIFHRCRPSKFSSVTARFFG